MGVLGTDRKKFLWEVVDDHVIEEENDGGVDDKKVLLYSNRWYVYVNEN